MERLSRNNFTSGRRGVARRESPAHGELKRLALEWALARRLVLAAMEVRLPRSAYRADVAAATPRALASNALTAVFECKASRADFLRDSAPETETASSIARLRERLENLHALIGSHRPDLRRSEELFPEFEAFDLRGLRHPNLRPVGSPAGGGATKTAGRHEIFETRPLALREPLLYLVAEDGLFAPHEIPAGWGLLVRRGASLELAVKPMLLRDTSAGERVALLERIAAAATRAHRAGLSATDFSFAMQRTPGDANFAPAANGSGD